MDKIPLNTEVKIDLSWHQKAYGHIPDDSGHGKRGRVIYSWIDVDGERLYDIACYDGILRGAYGRKDLKIGMDYPSFHDFAKLAHTTAERRMLWMAASMLTTAPQYMSFTPEETWEEIIKVCEQGYSE